MIAIKVSSGAARGLRLNSDKTNELRPTKERVKESLFDILQFDLPEKSFLDLFGGTGQIGIEAISRGAGSVTIVESNKAHMRIIKNNISKLKNINDICVINTDAIKFLDTANQIFDIIFIDPPYENINLLNTALNKIAAKCANNAIIITETLLSQNAQNTVQDFALQKQYKYGKITLNLYKMRKSDF